MRQSAGWSRQRFLPSSRAHLSNGPQRLGNLPHRPEVRRKCKSVSFRPFAVIEAVSGDAHNPLARFAAKNATPKSPSEKDKPVYQLTQKLVTTSASKDKRTLQCSGGISVLYGDLKATKEIEFTVQQAADGKRSVSVQPFEF